MQILYFFEDIRNPFLTALFTIFSFIGEELIVIGLICALFWCVNKDFAYRLGMGFFVSGLLVQGLKITFRVDRPWVIDPSFTKVEGIATKSATGYSFPSGHTQSATALFTSLAIVAKRSWQRILCVIAFILVGTARMYLGVHTPADVLTAMVLTVLSIFAANYISDCIEKGRFPDIAVAAVISLISAAIAVYSLMLFGNEIIPLKYASDCCKTAGAGIGFGVGWYIERRFVKYETHCPKLWMQAVKLAAGLGSALGFKELLKAVLGSSLYIDILRYFVLVVYALAIFPMILMKIPGLCVPKPQSEGTAAQSDAE